MERIFLSKNDYEELLTPTIKQTDVLSDNAKKVMAVIIKLFLEYEIAQTKGYLCCPNSTLRESCEIGQDELFSAIAELKQCNLIIRESGESYAEGKKGQASKYYIRWDNLNKPIEKLSPLQFLMSRVGKSPEAIMGKESNIPTDNGKNYCQDDDDFDTLLEKYSKDAEYPDE